MIDSNMWQTSEVGRQAFDVDGGVVSFDLLDGSGKVVGALVWLVVPVYGRDDNVAEAPARDRFGCVGWLVWVERGRRFVCFDGAEAAASGALIACCK